MNVFTEVLSSGVIDVIFDIRR